MKFLFYWQNRVWKHEKNGENERKTEVGKCLNIAETNGKKIRIS